MAANVGRGNVHALKAQFEQTTTISTTPTKSIHLAKISDRNFGQDSTIKYNGETYTIQKSLGSGGFGEVYLVQDKKGEEFAIKIMGKHKDDFKKEDVVREFNIQRSLNHPNITKVYDMAETKDVVMIRMEYVEGQDLNSQLEDEWPSTKKHPLPPEDYQNLDTQLTDAVIYMQRQGICHGDLKPQNIMKTKDGNFKIIDFGLANRISEADGGHAGSYFYSPPEIFASGKTKDNAKGYDLFALGAVLLKAKTGMDENDYAYKLGAESHLAEYSGQVMQESANMLGSGKYTDHLRNIEKDGADILGDSESKIKGLLSNNLEERNKTLERYS